MNKKLWEASKAIKNKSNLFKYEEFLEKNYNYKVSKKFQNRCGLCTTSTPGRRWLVSLREEGRSPEDPLKSSLEEPLRPSGQTSSFSSHACEVRRETSTPGRHLIRRHGPGRQFFVCLVINAPPPAPWRRRRPTFEEFLG